MYFAWSCQPRRWILWYNDVLLEGTIGIKKERGEKRTKWDGMCVCMPVCVSDTRLLPVPWSHGWPDLPSKASELTIWGNACWYPDLSCIIHYCTYTHAQRGDPNSPFASVEILAQIPHVALSEPVNCISVTDITVHCTNWPRCGCVMSGWGR